LKRRRMNPMPVALAVSALMPAAATACLRPRCLISSRANHRASRSRPLTNGTAMRGKSGRSGREHGRIQTGCSSTAKFMVFFVKVIWVSFKVRLTAIQQRPGNMKMPELVGFALLRRSGEHARTVTDAADKGRPPGSTARASIWPADCGRFWAAGRQ